MPSSPLSLAACLRARGARDRPVKCARRSISVPSAGLDRSLPRRYEASHGLCGPLLAGEQRASSRSAAPSIASGRRERDDCFARHAPLFFGRTLVRKTLLRKSASAKAWCTAGEALSRSRKQQGARAAMRMHPRASGRTDASLDAERKGSERHLPPQARHATEADRETATTASARSAPFPNAASSGRRPERDAFGDSVS